ncbi:MAG: hypothetical protein V2A77_00780 [Pseudomonadota bacterium]
MTTEPLGLVCLNCGHRWFPDAPEPLLARWRQLRLNSAWRGRIECPVHPPRWFVSLFHEEQALEDYVVRRPPSSQAKL